MPEEPLVWLQAATPINKLILATVVSKTRIMILIRRIEGAAGRPRGRRPAYLLNDGIVRVFRPAIPDSRRPGRRVTSAR
ncbi:MAG TPA: hypothetical protein VFA50_14570 [Stellaceae bacterium]|nr:hypothetical protein [Stellaceae bacterium]